MNEQSNKCICDADQLYVYCPVHVECDDKCKALKNPQTFEEYRAAYEHWRDHAWLLGCSHGS